MSDLPAPDARDDRTAVRGALPAAGDLLARNHDDDPHRVAVRVYDDGGAVVHEAGVDLAAGAAVARPASLPPGRYTVEVDCDGDDAAALGERSPAAPDGVAGRYLVTTCELGADDGLVVAVGNGVVDATGRPLGRWA